MHTNLLLNWKHRVAGNSRTAPINKLNETDGASELTNPFLMQFIYTSSVLRMLMLLLLLLLFFFRGCYSYPLGVAGSLQKRARIFHFVRITYSNGQFSLRLFIGYRFLRTRFLFASTVQFQWYVIMCGIRCEKEKTNAKCHRIKHTLSRIHSWTKWESFYNRARLIFAPKALLNHVHFSFLSDKQ